MAEQFIPQPDMTIDFYIEFNIYKLQLSHLWKATEMLHLVII